MTYRILVSTSTYPNTMDFTRSGIAYNFSVNVLADVLKAACKAKHQESIDMYYESGIYETTYLGYLIDELHLTNSGRRLISDKLTVRLNGK